MNPAEIRKIMKFLLRGLTTQQVDQLAEASVGKKVPAGHVLIDEGDRPSGLVLILQGRVEVFKHGPDGKRQSLASIDAPTLVGEMSVLLDRRASATVVTLTACEFLLLTRTQFQRLIAGDSIAAYKLVMIIARVLADRLAKLDRKVLELTGHWNF